MLGNVVSLCTQEGKKTDLQNTSLSFSEGLVQRGKKGQEMKKNDKYHLLYVYYLPNPHY